MKKLLGKILIGALLVGVSMPANVNAANEKVTEIFSDVQEGAWYVDAVQYVYDQGIMVGSNGTFKPTQNITRAQLMVTLYNLAGAPKVTDRKALTDFSDVEADKYYTDAICWAYNTGVGSGNAGKFQPNASLTRQQMATFFFNFAGVMGYDTSIVENYSSMLNADKVGLYARQAVSWAVGTGLISGSKTTDANGKVAYDLKPTAETTRAQVATILQKFCEEIRDKEENVWSYKKNSDGTITITAYKGEANGKVEIPAKIDGLTVTAIGDYVFMCCDKLEKIVIPETVEKIGNGTFVECFNLKDVTLPENLKEIGISAFGHNWNLESIVIPEGVTEIPYGAFSSCEKLKSVEFPKTLQRIGASAFKHCANLAVLEIPENVVSIGEYAFSDGDSGLSRVLFFGDAPQIDKYAFSGAICDAYYFSEKEGWDQAISQEYKGKINWISLNQLPEANQQEWLYVERNDGTLCLVQYVGDEILKNVVVPTEVNGKKITAIGAGAFANRDDLIEVTIPKQITSIEKGAFSQCESLKKVIFEGQAPSMLSSNIFYGVEAEIYYPANEPTWNEQALMYLTRGSEKSICIPYDIN